MNQRLPRSTPEAHGIESAAIERLVTALDQQIHHVHSLMVMRHGSVLAEGWWAPYQPGDQHVLFSLSKSFTSTAVGLAIAEGRLSLDDRVLQWFPDEQPAHVSENLANLTIHHLLSMGTGHTEDTLMTMFQQPDGNWARGFLHQPLNQPPGTFFLYNTGATYMLAAILHKITGQSLLEYLEPRLYQPLGMQQPTWEVCPRGINVGGWGMTATTEDIACFGQLYLQHGQWHGQQLIPHDWVVRATQKHISNGSLPESDWEQGYGYQFWMCRHHAYRGDGAFGQYCVIVPEHQLVIAITSGLGDMQPVLDILWNELLPALRDQPLPENPVQHQQLCARLAGLQLPTPVGIAHPTHDWSGTYTVEAQQSGATQIGIAHDQASNQLTLTLTQQHGSHTLQFGHNQWVRSETTYEPQAGRLGPPRVGVRFPIAASGAWIDPQTFIGQVWYTGGPFGWHVRCHVDNAQVALQFTQHVGFVPADLPELRGRR